MRINSKALHPGRASASVDIQTSAPSGWDFVLLSGEVRPAGSATPAR